MFIINALGGGIAYTLTNNRNFPTEQVEDNVRSAVEEIKKYIPKDLWVPILQNIFRSVVAVSAYLPLVGIVSDILKDLDSENKLPFDEIRDACYAREYGRLTYALDSVEEVA